MYAISALVILSLAVFWGILNLEFVLAQIGMPGTSIPGLWKFVLSVIEMILVGQIMIRRFNMSGEMGLILLRSKHGLNLINRLAKNESFWKFFSDTGTTISYGLMSVVLMGKNTSTKSVFTGIVLLLLLSYIVAPSVFPFLTDVLKVSAVEKAKQQISISDSSLFSPFFLLAGLLILVLGGLFLILLLSIILYGVIILKALISTIFAGTNAISQTSPGGTFLLPGVNLPFFEGIAALLIILAVHEVAHAVLSRIAKVPVLSSGIVLFGVIPIGAFVEPDEAKLAKTKKVAQTRVLIAGSTSNLIFSMIFFVLFILFAISMRFLNVFSIPIAAEVANFLYLVLGMAFALNFIVGSVNLLPLPFFDGYRALDVNIKNKLVMKGLMIITLLSFLMNFLPWLFVK